MVAAVVEDVMAVVVIEVAEMVVVEMIVVEMVVAVVSAAGQYSTMCLYIYTVAEPSEKPIDVD